MRQTAFQVDSADSLDLGSARWMVPVAVGVLVIYQLVTRTFDRFLEWDEAVYFSQVAADHVPAVLASQRSRLVSFAAWPVGLVSDSVILLRVYLLVLVSVASLLVGRRLKAFGVWALFGFAIFLVSVMPAFYAAELSPNLWVGLVALAIVMLITIPMRTRRYDLIGLAVMGGVLVLLRPPDGVIFLTGTGVVMLARMGLRDFPRMFALAGGGILGLALWALDAVSRLGSVSAVVDDGSRQVTAGLGFRLALYADRLDGPTRGLNFDGISLLALVPWLIIAGMAVVALGFASRVRRERPADADESDFAWLVLIGGGLLAAEYIIGSATQTVRYIFPGWLLLGVGVGMLAGRAVRGATGRGVAWLLFVLVVASQGVILGQFSEGQRVDRAPMAVAGEFLANNTGGATCWAASQYGAPQVGFSANCSVSALRGPQRTLDFLEARAAESGVAFLFMFGEPSDGYEDLGEYERLDIGDGRFWSVLEVSPS